MLEIKEIKPESIKVEPAAATNTWNYQESVKTVRGLYFTWKSITEEMLEELWLAKQAITNGGRRKSGMPKTGEQSWSAYIKECFGDSLSKRSADSYVKYYFENGKKKPKKLTVSTITDPTKLVLNSIEKQGDRIKLDIYLPVYNTHYTQYIAA